MEKGSSITFGVLLGVTILSGIILSSNTAKADEPYHSSSANASVTVSAACTLSSTGGGTYSETINNGHSEEIDGSTISAVCNDPNGYSLYAIGFTNDSYNDNNDKLISSVSPDYNISTNTTTSGSSSSWAMKVNPTTGNAPTITNNFNNYHIVPATYAQVATYNSSTSTPSSTGASVDAKYQVYISGSQPAGTYTGKVKYTLVHPNNAPKPSEPLPDSACPANFICYAPNASDIVGSMSSLGTVSGYPTAGKKSGAGATPTLIAPNYSRPGYGFAGWSTDFTATTSSTIYGPNETLENNDTTKGLILYPVWIASAGYLQDTTKVAELCGTGAGSLTQATYNSTTGKMEATLSSMSALTDQRDGNVYTIAKLADGKCWMTENLRIEAENTIGDTNKNLSQGYGMSATYGNFTGLATSENANFTAANPPVANSLYSTDGSTTNTIKGDDSSHYYARMPRYNNNNTNRNLRPSYSGTGSDTYYQWHSYGNYYTWAAAMANVKYYTSPTSKDDEGKTSETANTSICPSGWRLPYGRNTGNGATASGMEIFENDVDVLTNQPGYGWHKENLRNYMNLFPQMPKEIKWNKATMTAFGSGSLMRGLPGGFYSTDRFIRVAYLNTHYPVQSDEASNVSRLFHTLTGVAMIDGAAAMADGQFEKTIYTCGYSTATQTYYYNTYEDPSIKSVGMKDHKLDSTEIIVV